MAFYFHRKEIDIFEYFHVWLFFSRTKISNQSLAISKPVDDVGIIILQHTGSTSDWVSFEEEGTQIFVCNPVFNIFPFPLTPENREG